MPREHHLTQPQIKALLLAIHGKLNEHNAAVETLDALSLNGNYWITWTPGPDATITPAGREVLRDALDQDRFLAQSGTAHNYCQRCSHVRGAHGVHPAKREHQECLEPGCDCGRYVAGDETDSDHGYTTSIARSLPGAGTVVPEADQRRITAEAHERDAKLRDEKTTALKRDRELLAVEDRLLAVERTASARRVDVSGEAWLCRKMLARGREEAAKLRVVKIETQLDKAA